MVKHTDIVPLISSTTTFVSMLSFSISFVLSFLLCLRMNLREPNYSEQWCVIRVITERQVRDRSHRTEAPDARIWIRSSLFILLAQILHLVMSSFRAVFQTYPCPHLLTFSTCRVGELPAEGGAAFKVIFISKTLFFLNWFKCILLNLAFDLFWCCFPSE